MRKGKGTFLLLILVSVTVVFGNDRKTRALPFPDGGTVGVSKTIMLYHEICSNN